MKKAWIGVSVLLTVPLAHAQSTSDLMPATAAPAGGASMQYPGAPAPAPSAGASAPAGAPAAAGRSRGYIIDDGSSSVYGSEDGTVSTDGPVPDFHIVKKGDTLWTLAANYFKSPWYWPKLWSYNASITNPHWIYPGDRVALQPPAKAAAPALAESPAEPGEPLRIAAPTGVFLRQIAFIEPNELKYSAKIVGSREEKIMLGSLDEIYVEYDKEHPLHLDERYTIYRPTDIVKHPVTGKKLGQMVEILGEMEIRAVTDGRIARGVVIDTINPIERGYRVGPLKRQFKRVPPSAAKEDMQGVIVSAIVPSSLLASEMLVFLDRGKKDGVEIGNRFMVTRRGDGYVPLLARGPIDDRRFPRENIAEILVVEVRDGISAGLITRAIKEARPGDRIETKKGK